MLRQLRKIGRWLWGTRAAARCCCRPRLELLEGRLAPAVLAAAAPIGGAVIASHEASSFTADGTIVPRGTHLADSGTLLSGAVVVALRQNETHAATDLTQPPLPVAALSAALANLPAEPALYDVRTDLFATGGGEFLESDAISADTDATRNLPDQAIPGPDDPLDPFGADVLPSAPNSSVAPQVLQPRNPNATDPAAEAAPTLWHYDFRVQSE